MIQTLKKGAINLTPVPGGKLDKDTIKQALWIDLMSASDAEHELIEKLLGISIPSEEEMHEIEESSRLFKVNDALYLSCYLLCYDSPIPANASVTFIVSKDYFLSIRHTDHHAFRVFTPARHRKHAHRFRDSGDVFAEVMDSITNHIAYTLRLVEQDLNELSVEIFAEQKGHLAKANKLGLKKVVKRLGKRNSLVSNLRESSVSLSMIRSIRSSYVVTTRPPILTAPWSPYASASKRSRLATWWITIVYCCRSSSASANT